jgi:hypothetical protein
VVKPSNTQGPPAVRGATAWQDLGSMVAECWMVGEWLKKYVWKNKYIESMDWIGLPGERKNVVWNMLKPSNFQRRTGVSTVWPTNSVGQPSSKISRSALQGKQQHWWRVFWTPKPATVGFCRLGSPRLNTNYTSRLDWWEWPTWYPSSQHQIKATIWASPGRHVDVGPMNRSNPAACFPQTLRKEFW